MVSLMNRNEFMEQVSKLERVYGAKYFPIERTNILWEKVQRMSVNEFSELVSQIIGEYYTPPSMSKISEMIQIKNSKYAAEIKFNKEAWLKSQPFCELCGKTGFVLAKEIGSEIYKYAFKCTCPIGEKFNFNYPEWISGNNINHLPILYDN